MSPGLCSRSVTVPSNGARMVVFRPCACDHAEGRSRDGQFAFGHGELAIGIVQLAARCCALVDEHSNAALRELGLLHAKIRGLHRRCVDGGLRAERRKFEPHEHLAALDSVSDVLRDLRNARRLRGDDGERRSRQCADDAGRADRCADGSEPDRLGDDRNRRLGLGFPWERRGCRRGER